VRFLLEKTNQENKIVLSGHEAFQSFIGKMGIGGGGEIDEAVVYRSLIETGCEECAFDHTKTSLIPDCLIPLSSKFLTANSHR